MSINNWERALHWQKARQTRVSLEQICFGSDSLTTVSRVLSLRLQRSQLTEAWLLAQSPADMPKQAKPSAQRREKNKRELLNKMANDAAASERARTQRASVRAGEAESECECEYECVRVWVWVRATQRP